MKYQLLAAAVLALGGVPGAQAQAAAPPAPYQSLYNSLAGQMGPFQTAAVLQPNYSTVFAAELITANSNRGPALLTGSYTGVLMELDSLRALGVRAVKVAIHFPLLYPGYYSNPATYQQYVNFYTQLANDVRARGLKLIVETGIVLNEPGITTFNCAPFYNSLTLSQYENGRMQVAVEIARQIRPDYLSVLNEPDTEAAQSGKPQLGTPAGSAAMLNVILSGLKQAGISGVSIGAGVGTWLPAYDTFVRAYAAMPVQFIDMHVFPVNHNYLARVSNIAAIAHAAGKEAAVSQAWLDKVSDTELGKVSFAQTASRDPFSFWSPLDVDFLKTMVGFAGSNNLAFFSPFYSLYFHSYLDYATARSLSASQLMGQLYSGASQSISGGQYTATGRQYSRFILPAADTTCPSIPNGLAAATPTATIVHLTWNPSNDNVGVAGYAVYRNGILLGATSTTSYFDTSRPRGAKVAYQVVAYDVAGNLSAPEGPVSVK